MAATVHQFVRSGDHQGELAESKAVSGRQRSADGRSRWVPASSNRLASEAVFRRRIRLASLIAVSLLSLGLWVAILWVLASLISVVRG
jgi:hypothetical protein